jgi:hypothetical protein
MYCDTGTSNMPAQPTEHHNKNRASWCVHGWDSTRPLAECGPDTLQLYKPARRSTAPCTLLTATLRSVAPFLKSMLTTLPDGLTYHQWPFCCRHCGVYSTYIPPTLLSRLLVIIRQHQAGNEATFRSWGTQFVPLPHFRRTRISSWLSLVHPGAVLMARHFTVCQFQLDLLNHPSSSDTQHLLQ